MAAYKAEVLHQSYRRRLRPRPHYTLGRLPRWADLAARAPRLVNAVMTSRLGGRLAKWTAGVDQRRDLPPFAERTFHAGWAARSRRRGHDGGDGGRPVALWVDSFTDHFAPDVAEAAVAVLEAAGYRVQVPAAEACCALTWITTGQLDAARRTLARTVGILAPLAEAGTPIVGVEPSCTAVLRGEALELVGGAAAERVAAGTRTLAELLRETPGWAPPSLAGVEVVAQPHCHHHAVLGWAADERLLRDAGADVTRLGGCCGLAGNWGVERGHHDVSVAIAEHQLLPAVRAAGPDAVVLADGFSCRTQLDQLAGRRAVHLAELLAHPPAPAP
jgi:Fe-S oxidoreductase